MSTSTHPIIVPSDYDVEDAFSSIHSPDYTPVSSDYFPVSPGNTSPDSSDDLTKYLLASLAISPFHDDPYMKVMQAYNATSNESPIPLPQIYHLRKRAVTYILPLNRCPTLKYLNLREFYHKRIASAMRNRSRLYLKHLMELPLEQHRANMEDKIKGIRFSQPGSDKQLSTEQCRLVTTNRNTGEIETPVARKCSYKEL
ncbi:hypothetical protein Tco_0922077 [Tanacetum coccineum]|uniref:Uncharacterized protein n=1 Tax=Tanacetum coccineum TaxID=301880 RepID=A0ABQ5CY49_9ASTR